MESSAKKFSRIFQSRGVLAILGVVAILLFAILIGRIIGMNPSDNQRVIGQYNGTLSGFDDAITLQLDFDGKEYFSGNVTIGNDTYSFSDANYVCMNDQISFSFEIPDLYYFYLNGSINEDNTLLQGDAQYTNNAQNSYEGSFYITKTD
ncbi:MAG: hypothetical protein ACTSVU_01050 [Promethearchaeota archaeon]